MHHPKSSLIAIAALLAVVAWLGSPSAQAAEMVDNPQYLSWSKHKTGTTVTLKQDIAMGPMNLSGTTTQTLVELTADKAVIEHATTMDVAGQKQESKNKQEIPSKVEKGKEFNPSGKGTAKETGTEKVDVAGKSYECKIIEMTGGEGDQNKASGKMWHTTEIPGGAAKLELKMEAPQQGTIKMIVTGMEMK